MRRIKERGKNLKRLGFLAWERIVMLLKGRIECEKVELNICRLNYVLHTSSLKCVWTICKVNGIHRSKDINEYTVVQATETQDYYPNALW